MGFIAEVKIARWNGSTLTWLTIDQDDVVTVSVERPITERIGKATVYFDQSSSDLNIQTGDILILNMVEEGNDMIKVFEGSIDKPMETGEMASREMEVSARGGGFLLLNNNPDDKNYENEQGVDILTDICTNITYDGSTETVTDEPVYVSQLDYWIPLSCKTISNVSVSGGLVVTTDYTLDTANGRIKFLSSGSATLYNSYDVTYDTSKPRPGTWEITVDGLDAGFTELLNETIVGISIFDAIRQVCLDAITKQDFYLDPYKELTTFEKGTGSTIDLSYGDVLEFDSYEDTTYIINKTEVRSAVGSGDSFPSDGDSYTEFAGAETPTSKGWTIYGYTDGVFDGIKFDSGHFDNGTYQTTPTVTTPGGVVGSNCIKAVESSSIKALVFELTLSGTQNLYSADYSPITFYSQFTGSVLPNGFIAVEDSSGRVSRQTFTPTSSFVQTSVTKPTGWSGDSSIEWDNIKKIRISFCYPNGEPMTVYLDGLVFGGDTIVATAEDATSQTVYGIRTSNSVIPYPFIDPTIRYAAEAQSRANAIIAEYKDPITRIERAYMDYGDLTIEPGDDVRIEKENGSFYDTTRVLAVTHKISGWDMSTELECKSGSPGALAYSLRQLEKEIRALENDSI